MLQQLVLPMLVHVLLAALLYALLTVARAPAIWGIGRRPDGSNPFATYEPLKSGISLLKGTMKILAFVLLGTYAAIATAQAPTREQLIGQALDDFATVAGAWYLNQRCAFITEGAAKTFDGDVAIINVTLAQDLGNPQILFNIQAAAKSVAGAEKYAGCGDEARSIVMSRSAHAHEWADRIRSAKSEEMQAN